MDENCYEERKPLIFAVDDDEINLLLISRILGEFTEVRTAQSGTEALNYLAENSVDLVLMDYNMPERDGLETLKYMKHSRAEMKNVPVIILTGDTDLDLETEVFRSGAVDFIRKPFVPMAMQERVRVAKRVPEAQSAQGGGPADEACQGAGRRHGAAL